MWRNALFVIPTAMVPGALHFLERAGAADAMSGMTVGGLFGLSVLGLLNASRRTRASICKIST